MQPPIIVRSEGDLLVFDSPEDAIRYVEVPDVESDLYRAWDAGGTRLFFRVARRTRPRRLLPQQIVESVVLTEDPAQNPSGQELRDELVDYLSRRDFGRQELEDLSLDALVDRAHEHYRVT